MLIGAMEANDFPKGGGNRTAIPTSELLRYNLSASGESGYTVHKPLTMNRPCITENTG